MKKQQDKTQTNAMRKIGKYLRELSVVVLGIAITLSVSVWVTNRNEKRDLALYLNAIKIELEENLSSINDAMVYFQSEAKYTEYLQLHDEQTVNMDTISYYMLTACYHLNAYQLNTNAFEMFRSSGAMRLMKDKDLLISIWKAYNRCSSMEKMFDRYYDRKFEHFQKEAQFSKKGSVDYNDMNYALAVPMYNFYAFPLATAILNAKDDGIKPVKETITLLESLNE